MKTQVLEKVELDNAELLDKVTTYLHYGATVRLVSRSTGSGESTVYTVKPDTLADPDEVVAALSERARLIWDGEDKVNKVADEYRRTPRGLISHYVKISGKK